MNRKGVVKNKIKRACGPSPLTKKAGIRGKGPAAREQLGIGLDSLCKGSTRAFNIEDTRTKASEARRSICGNPSIAFPYRCIYLKTFR